MSDLDPLIAELRERRHQRGLRPYVLADLVGLSQQVVYSTEAGRRSPTLHSLRAWADVLGYDLALVRRADADERTSA